MAETGATLAKVCALAASVFQKGGFVFVVGGSGGLGVRGFELSMAGLAVVDVTEEIEVVVEEVCGD